MRISDWSSDVCSSDLAAGELVWVFVEALRGGGDLHPVQHLQRPRTGFAARYRPVPQHHFGDLVADAVDGIERGHGFLEDHGDAIAADRAHPARREAQQVLALEERAAGDHLDRSEEHTSELPSLMRISYA